MNQNNIPVRRALISVSDKTNLIPFARELHHLNIELISTGGTSQLLRDENIPVRDVSEITQFPEMMNGRLKTLHPKIHGGILGLRDQHEAVAKSFDISWIDLVIVNLYPFAETIKKPNVQLEQAIENIDIGGPTMIRAAAKNMSWVGVVVEPTDYQLILDDLKKHNALSFNLRKELAIKAFAHTANYDAVITNYFLNQDKNNERFPQELNINLIKQNNLRYGENPHQEASSYRFANQDAGILLAKQHQGKQLSYNNIVDADAAFSCIRDFEKPACAIIKHANPCGVALADTVLDAFQRAFAADSLSAFGGVIAFNKPCTKEVAEAIKNYFFEVVIAPEYSSEALAILATKPNLRLLELKTSAYSSQELKFIEGGMLIQDKDNYLVSKDKLQLVTKLKPTEKQLETMLFAWQVVKHIKSNAILIAKDDKTLGIGAGQVSRVDAVDIAIKKSGKEISNAMLASDAFFPFRDSIDRLANTGLVGIIQPGGSVKDSEVIDACNEHGIAMVLTGIRSFKH